MMSDWPRQRFLKLGAFFHPTGHHVAAWRHEGAQIDAGTNFPHYVRLAQAAESAKFDLVFLADAVATRDGNLEGLSRWPQYMAYFEPLTLMSALAAVTSRIGLVMTATTSYNEPYHIARKFASLDHISGGRAGWNVVTSSNASEAFNFGRDEHIAHGERYDRAAEFVHVVKRLWDSYDDDAFVRDRASGRYFEPSKLHSLNHKGTHFSVRGPLNVARPPQGSPVLFQASASEAGKDLAGQIAEVLFTPLHDLEKGRAFYRDIKDRALQYGRTWDDVIIMPGLNPIIGRTRDEAIEKERYFQSLIHPDVGKELLSNALGGVDLSDVEVDEPLPDGIISPEDRRSSPRFSYLFREKLTVRQMYEKYGSARGQRTVVGTADDVADQMERWFVNRAVDGYLVQPPHLPAGFDEFIEHVIPRLQERGLFRTEYEGSTLRENLGLKRPASSYAGAVA
jgi:FMN-dependent oxidoreductase (nitrilotriacetate monooxygenase family)